MAYLHAFLDPSSPDKVTPIIHRDLKSSNVLVTDKFVGKVADCGEARRKTSESTMTSTGTMHWMAPEVIKAVRYDEKADCYSFGLMLSEIIDRKIPYSALLKSGEVNRFVLMRKVSEEGLRPTVKEAGVNPDLIKLMKQCWHNKAKKRPAMKEITTAIEDILKTMNDEPYFAVDTDGTSGGKQNVEALWHYMLVDSRAIKKEALMASGVHGDVYHCIFTGLDAVLKEYKEETDSFVEEIQAMAMLSHPFILKMYAWCKTPNAIVYECAKKGNVVSAYGSEGFSFPHAVRMSEQVANAVVYLHSWSPAAIVHGCLLPKNVLVTERWHAKLVKCGKSLRSDFQDYLSKKILREGDLDSAVPYTAPEVMAAEQPACATASDAYSLAVLVVEILKGRRPFAQVQAPSEDLKRMIVSGELSAASEIDARWNPALITVLRSALDREPQRRTDAGVICHSLHKVMQAIESSDTKLLEADIKETEQQELIEETIEDTLALWCRIQIKPTQIKQGRKLGVGGFADGESRTKQEMAPPIETRTRNSLYVACTLLRVPALFLCTLSLCSSCLPCARRTVFSCTLAGRQEKFALKVLRGDVTAETQDKFLKEIKMMFHLLHPNILSLHAWSDSPMAMVLEFAPHGDLQGFYRKKDGPYTVRKAVKLCLVSFEPRCELSDERRALSRARRARERDRERAMWEREGD